MPIPGFDGLASPPHRCHVNITPVRRAAPWRLAGPACPTLLWLPDEGERHLERRVHEHARVCGQGKQIARPVLQCRAAAAARSAPSHARSAWCALNGDVRRWCFGAPGARVAQATPAAAAVPPPAGPTPAQSIQQRFGALPPGALRTVDPGKLAAIIALFGPTVPTVSAGAPPGRAVPGAPLPSPGAPAAVAPRQHWTKMHARWLTAQKFTHPTQQIVFQDQIEAINAAQVRLITLEQQLRDIVPTWTMAPVVAAYQALRGVSFLVISRSIHI
jgi:hypothetical protein